MKKNLVWDCVQEKRLNPKSVAESGNERQKFKFLNLALGMEVVVYARFSEYYI